MRAALLSSLIWLAAVSAQAMNYNEPAAFDPRSGRMWLLQGWASGGAWGCEGHNLRLVEVDERARERAVLPLWSEAGRIRSTPRQYRTLGACEAAKPTPEAPELSTWPVQGPPLELLQTHEPHPNLRYDLRSQKTAPHGLHVTVEGFVPDDFSTMAEPYELEDEGYPATRVTIRYPQGGKQVVEYYGRAIGKGLVWRTSARVLWTKELAFVTWTAQFASANTPDYASTTEMIRLDHGCATLAGQASASCRRRIGHLNLRQLRETTADLQGERRVRERCAAECRYCSAHKDPMHGWASCAECVEQTDCPGGHVCALDGTCRDTSELFVSDLRFRGKKDRVLTFRTEPNTKADLVGTASADCLLPLGIAVFAQDIEWWFLDIGSGKRGWVDMRELAPLAPSSCNPPASERLP